MLMHIVIPNTSLVKAQPKPVFDEREYDEEFDETGKMIDPKGKGKRRA